MDGMQTGRCSGLQPLERREKIIGEILHTEETYLNHLNMIITYFLGPLRSAHLIPLHVIQTIFSNIEQIHCVNQELQQHLRSSGVGDAFLSLSPFLKLYSTYANNHEKALATLLEWEQKSPSFGVWRREQEDLEVIGGLKLNALLITPVQRIPRYKLLLEDLLHCTERSSGDFEAIKESVRCMTEVASHINNHIKQQDNFNKMVAIQKSLSGGSTTPKLIIPGRVFIKEGVLQKIAKNGKGRKQERKFFLFSDILMYAKHKFLENGSVGSYVCSCILPLQHCVVSRVLGNTSHGDGSLFTVICKQESLLLFSDHSTVDSWMTALQSTICTLVKRRQTLRKLSSAKQPLRRTGLIHLRRLQKVTDPLASVSKKQSDTLTERLGKSPMRLKRALQDADINCLSAGKHHRTSDIMISPPYATSRLGSSSLEETDQLVTQGIETLTRSHRSGDSEGGPPLKPVRECEEDENMKGETDSLDSVFETSPKKCCSPRKKKGSPYKNASPMRYYSPIQHGKFASCHSTTTIHEHGDTASPGRKRRSPIKQAAASLSAVAHNAATARRKLLRNVSNKSGKQESAQLVGSGNISPFCRNVSESDDDCDDSDYMTELLSTCSSPQRTSSSPPSSPTHFFTMCGNEEDDQCDSAPASPNSILSAIAANESLALNRHVSSVLLGVSPTHSTQPGYPCQHNRLSTIVDGSDGCSSSSRSDDSFASNSSQWRESADWYMRTYSAADIQRYIDCTAQVTDQEQHL